MQFSTRSNIKKNNTKDEAEKQFKRRKQKRKQD